MNRLHQWRRWIRPLVMFIYFILLVVALPLMIIELQKTKTDIYVQFWFIGGMFVLLSMPISLWTILQHLVHYTEPNLQRHIIRILWMVPIYAINAWFALKFPAASIYLDTARECYEAYVIYNFMSYLLNYLQISHPDLEAYVATKPQIKHLVPVCWLPPWRMGRDLIANCKHGVMQYTVLRPLTTVVAFACAMVNEKYYGEGEFSFQSAWSYLVIINNLSQIFAMYCLVLFYKATRDELSPIKPVSKFLCVKAVVFLSFWQSIVIAIIVSTGVVKLEKGATVIQDFCICIEMFLAAVAHYFSFSHQPFIDLAADTQNCFVSFKSMWDFSDVQKDVVEHIKHVGYTASGVLTSPLHVGRRVRVHETEMTPLLSSGDEATVARASAGTETASEADFEGLSVEADGQNLQQSQISSSSSAAGVVSTSPPVGANGEAAPLMNFISLEDGSSELARHQSKLQQNGQSISVRVEVHNSKDNVLIGTTPWDELPNHET